MAGRLNVAPELDGELELSAVARHFGESWLNAGSNRPLQKLWQRQDWLATVELMTVGHCLRELEHHASWLARPVAKAKRRDAGNAAGAVFEVLALGYFTSAGMRVEPAAAHQAGSDACLHYPGGGKVTLSIKRQGISDAQAEFERACESIYPHLARKYPGRALVIWSDRKVPDESDWRALLATLLAPNPGPLHGIDVGPWTIWNSDLAALGTNLDLRSSFQLNAFARHDRNEVRHLETRLVKACENLQRHGPRESSLAANVILLRVRPTADFESAAATARRWLQNQSNAVQISSVLLYQPTVVRDASNACGVYHRVYSETRADRIAAILPGEPSATLSMLVPIGKCGTVPSTIQLALDDRRLDLRDTYAWQHGVHVKEMQPTNDGEWSGALTSPAPGVSVRMKLPQHLDPLGTHGLMAKLPDFDELSVM